MTKKKRGGARLVLAVIAVFVLALGACGGDDDDAGATDSGSDGSSSSDVLGEPNPAEGEPVKIGLITNGVGQGFDQGGDEPMAKAVAGWMNEYSGGIGGRPVEMVICEDMQDPGRAADCASEMISEEVTAVVYSSNGGYEASWKPLSEAGVPTFIHAVGAPNASKETTNTFIFNNSLATTIDGPLGLAEENDADIMSVIAVDVPAATVNYREGRGPSDFEEAGVELDLVPVPIGTPDMTVQTAEIVRNNPDGIVNILGTDAFCSAALNGLKAAGFEGTISANEDCISANTVQAVGPEYIEGIRVIAQVPRADEEDPSTEFYNAIVEEFGEGMDEEDIDNGEFMFLAMTGLDAATQELEGDVTHDSIIAAAKSMPWTEQLGSSGRHIRCNGKADPAVPAVCSNAVLLATLDGEGQAASYEVLLDEEIPD